MKIPSVQEHRLVHKSQLPWLVLLWIQGAGILTVFAPTGLDLGYNWSVTKATEQKLFGQELFVGPYGPLGFLEFAYPSWSMGFALSIFWKLAISSFLFLSLCRLFKKRISHNYLVYLFSIAIVTLMNSINMTSTILIAVYCIRAITLEPCFVKTLSRGAFIDGLIITTAFLIKPLPFLMISIFTIIYYLRKAGVIQNLTILLFVSAFSLIGILILSGYSFESFQFWLRGYLEVSKGYTDMSNEDPNRLFEYPLVILLSIYILFKILRTGRIFTFAGVGLVIYYSIRYGFNRHDGHAIFTFTIIFFLILSLTIYDKREKLSWMFFSLMILLLVSNYSPIEILNFNPRVANTLSATRTLTDASFRSTQNMVSKQTAFENYKLDAKIVEEIQGKTVSMLPLQEDLSAIGVKNLFPPMSSLFSAYTPWLDTVNADWVLSENAPEFFLLQPPTSIDGRFPYWDSPRFWIATLCNYKSMIVTDNWLLLNKRESSVCNYTDLSMNVRSSGNQIFTEGKDISKIQIVKLKQSQSLNDKILRLVFKPLTVDTVLIDGKSFRLVWNNQEFLPVHIPESLNLPTKWRFETIKEIKTTNISLFEIYTLKLRI